MSRHVEVVDDGGDRRRIKVAASMSVRCDEFVELTMIVNQLMTCSEHRGSHHFVVHGDTLTLMGSFAAERCLRGAGLI